jgi:hypothetical protein
MPPAAILPVLGIAGSVAGGVLNNTKGARTGENSATSTTNRTLSPELQPVQDELIQNLIARFQDPTKGTGDIRLAGRDSINRSFKGAEQGIADKFLSFQGGGKSGKFGNAAAQIEGARAGSLGAFEGDIAKLILERDDQNLNIAQRLLALGGGSETTQSGTFTNPGSAVGAGFSGGAETATALYALNKLLKN